MRKILLTLALLLPAVAFAQTTYDDGLTFGARATVEADAKLAKGLHLSAHEQFRYYGGSEDILRFYTGISLEYKVLPFLKVGAEYELINRCKYDESVKANTWSIRHRGNFFLTGTLKTGNWQFGLKETLRLTHRPGDMNTLQSPRNALALKSKLSAKYLGWGKVVPFAGFELRNALNDAAYSGTYNPSAKESKDKFTNEQFLGYNMYMCLALAVMFYALWAVDEMTVARAGGEARIWTVPLVILCCMRYSLDVEGNSDGDPVEVLLKDRLLLVLGLILAIVILAIIYI